MSKPEAVDGTSKQLDNINDAKLLKDKIDIDEGEILLRRTNLGLSRRSGRKSLTVPTIAVRVTAATEEDDEFSGNSTTSDVNSDDDAASIASRLSQIAIEQEEIILQTNPMTGSEGNKQPQSSPSTPTPQPTNQCLKQARSESNLRDMDAHVPEICVIADDGERQAHAAIQLDDACPIKERSKSVVVVNGRNEETNGSSPAHGRKSESSRLPERGNLRQLEISRSLQQAPRSRSNTAGSLDKPILQDQSGQLILNIRRSAWTLSQFDKTFEKDSTDEDDDKDDDGDELDSEKSYPRSDSPISSSLANQQHHQPINNCYSKASFTDRQQSNNLLIRASKNALNLSHSNSLHQVNMQTSGATNHSINGDCLRRGSFAGSLEANLCGLEARRLSHCHSIVSLSSSVESLYGSGKRRRRSLPNGDKSKRTDNDQDSDSDGGLNRCCKLSTFARYLPIIDWLPKYKLDYLCGDLTAGLAVAVLNISTSLSAAVVAETELSAAFRTSIINTFFFSILCSSKHTSFGSWSMISQMLVVSVRKSLSDELILNRINLGPTASWDPAEYETWHMNIIIMYTFLIGLIQFIFGLLNMGNLMASFIPEALCSSMISAAAFTMAIGQLANMLGTSNKILFSIERNTTSLWADLKNPPVDITDLFAGSFRWIQQIALLIKHSDQINMASLVVSVISVILLYLNQYVLQKQLKRLFKRNIFLPFELLLLILAIIVSYAMDLENVYKVRTCGPIYVDFPVPSIPDLRLVRELWSDALATALISYTMVYIMAKTYSNKFNYEVDCNQELIACGAGNLIGGLFDALPATASFGRTAGQVESGGRTQMASIFNCVMLFVTAQLLGHHVAVLPVCVMSASLFFAFIRMMSKISEVLVYWRICKVDFAIWLVTFVSILTLDMVNGFLYGFIFSILTMLYRAQNRRCYLLGTIGTSDVYVPLAKYPLAQEIDGIKIFQFCGPIHYVCAELFERLLRQKTRVNVKEILRDSLKNPNLSHSRQDRNLPTHIILDFSMISFIDSAGIHIIRKLIEDYKQINVTIFIASLASHVASVVKSEPSLWGVYKERFYVTLADAVHCAIRDSQKRDYQDPEHQVKGSDGR